MSTENDQGVRSINKFSAIPLLHYLPEEIKKTN